MTTLTSAASAATAQIIQDPLSAKDLLAKNLPKATNFYISYFLLQGLMMSSMALLQVASVIVYKLITTFFDYSPRRLYERWTVLTRIGWGNVFPVFTNMGVIGKTVRSRNSLESTTDQIHSLDILLYRTSHSRVCLFRAISGLPGVSV